MLKALFTDNINKHKLQDTLYLDDIEERENGGTPPIIQIIRAALTFWVKDYVGHEVIEKQEHIYIERALKRLLPNKNIWILGNTSAKRQAILSFLVYSTSNTSSNGESNGCSVNSRDKSEEGLYLWRETGNNRGKPLHGPFVAALLSDLFGIQARGGCACAGPYGHRLLDVDDTISLNIRSAVKKGYLGIKPGWARVSFPYYMSNEEFEFVLNALEFIATYAQRFLTLYHFNLKTGNWKLKKRAYKDLVAPLAGAFEIIGVEQGNSRKPAKTNHSEIIEKNSLYIKTAKQIANLLPKFPPQRRLPEDIDPDILLFRV
ncbi:hypothetical protein HS088_TW07G00719 [Tripterygium wilfordii]|uniref:Aminotransferase class V domain-containing protein n=1 Tax=Tripterygium wilfordii TaxID=458696 RepID=A0A7J7DFT8_TRIWF|nr:hypothetical protein HS088_TW07G00719 [Tripterygium wilfordii]